MTNLDYSTLSYEQTVRQLLSDLGCEPILDQLATTKTGRLLLVRAIKQVKLALLTSNMIDEDTLLDLAKSPPGSSRWISSAIEDITRWWREAIQESRVNPKLEQPTDALTTQLNAYVDFIIKDLQVIRVLPTHKSHETNTPEERQLLFLDKTEDVYRRTIVNPINTAIISFREYRWLLQQRYKEELNNRNAMIEAGNVVIEQTDIPVPVEDTADKIIIETLLQRAPKVLASNFNPEHLVRFLNGIYDLNDNSFVDETSEEYQKYAHYNFNARIPYNYKPNTQSKGFIKEVVDKFTLKDPQALMTLKTFLGYSLTSSIKHQVALVVVGLTASNGKSTIGNLIKQMFKSDTFRNTPFEYITTRFGGGTLEGTLLNITDDQARQYSPSTGVLKRIISETSFQVEPKGEKEYTITNMCKQMIFANDVIYGTELDTPEAIRRLIYLPAKARYAQTDVDNWELGVFKLIPMLSTYKYDPQELECFVNDCFQHYIDNQNLLNNGALSDPDLTLRARKRNNHTFEWLYTTNLLKIYTWLDAYLQHNSWLRSNGYKTTTEEKFRQSAITIIPELLTEWKDTSGMTKEEILEYKFARSLDDTPRSQALVKHQEKQTTKARNEETRILALQAYINQINLKNQRKLEELVATATTATNNSNSNSNPINQFKLQVLSFNIDLNRSCNENYKRFKSEFQQALPECASTLPKWIKCVQKLLQVPYIRKNNNGFFGVLVDRLGNITNPGTMFDGHIPLLDD